MCFAIRSCWHTVCVCYLRTQSHTVSAKGCGRCVYTRMGCVAHTSQITPCQLIRHLCHVTRSDFTTNLGLIPGGPCHLSSGIRGTICHCVRRAHIRPRAACAIFFLLWPWVACYILFFYNVFINGKSSKLYTDWLGCGGCWGYHPHIFLFLSLSG